MCYDCLLPPLGNASVTKLPHLTSTQGEGQATELQAFFDPARRVVTVKKPDVAVADDWTITLEF